MKIARLSPLPSQNKPMPTLELVQRLSAIKQEPSWMLAKRLQGLTAFQKLPLPSFGASLAKLNFEEIEYYQNAGIKEQSSWESVPASIKKTFEKLGIPQAEREYLAGVKSQYESEVIYGSLKQDLVKQGVIFLSMDEAVKKQPDLVKQYFGTIVSYDDNKFSALNTAVWSGGSFIYVPQGVCLKLPLQAYFRINSPYSGQFERTLIILEEGASLHYIEGCSAPVYSQNSLHSGVVEILVKKNASCQYSTIQNWSKNVYNLVTKRAYVEEDANMVWVDGNIGSKITMKYPACYLVGKRAHGELLSLSLAGTNQIQDTGGSMIHRAQETTSLVIAKSIAQKGGTASFRGWVNIKKQAKKTRSKVVCNTIILDDRSHCATYPSSMIDTDDTIFEHEATVSKISQEQLFYLQSRGLSEKQATSVILSGFVEPVIKQFPMEYAVELNRLIELEL